MAIRFGGCGASPSDMKCEIEYTTVGGCNQGSKHMHYYGSGLFNTGNDNGCVGTPYLQTIELWQKDGFGNSGVVDSYSDAGWTLVNCNHDHDYYISIGHLSPCFDYINHGYKTRYTIQYYTSSQQSNCWLAPSGGTSISVESIWTIF